MMIYDVIGYRNSSFKSSDGNTISGVTMYLTYSDSSVTGLVADRVFISTNKLNGYVPQLGDVVDVEYNKYGKVHGIMHAKY